MNVQWKEVRERVWEAKIDVKRGREPWGQMRAIAETLPDVQGVDYPGKPRSEPNVWRFTVYFDESMQGCLDILDGQETTRFLDVEKITWTLQVVFCDDQLHDAFKRMRPMDTWQARDA